MSEREPKYDIPTDIKSQVGAVVETLRDDIRSFERYAQSHAGIFEKARRVYGQLKGFFDDEASMRLYEQSRHVPPAAHKYRPFEEIAIAQKIDAAWSAALGVMEEMRFAKKPPLRGDGSGAAK